jgi:drug/metabolite transporter (DMT)-like permease
MAYSRPAELPPPDNMRGARWMVVSTLCFAISILAIKQLGTQLPPSVIVFFRCLVGFVVVLPFIFKHGLKIYSTKRPVAHVVRLICSIVSMIAAYYAYAHMELATAVSLTFTRPLFMIVLAILILGERVRWRRGLATLAGFIGVLIVLGPSDLAFHPAALSALLSAAAVSGAIAIIRQQAAVEGSLTLIVWFMTGTAILTAIPAALDWQTPQGIQWGYLVFIGLASSIGQFCMIQALSYGEATVMNPIDYGQLILAAMFGYLIFGEVPTIWTILGAVVIVSSTLYILVREARVSSKPPPVMLQE